MTETHYPTFNVGDIVTHTSGFPEEATVVEIFNNGTMEVRYYDPIDQHTYTGGSFQPYELVLASEIEPLKVGDIVKNKPHSPPSIANVTNQRTTLAVILEVNDTGDCSCGTVYEDPLKYGEHRAGFLIPCKSLMKVEGKTIEDFPEDLSYHFSAEGTSDDDSNPFQISIDLR